MLKPFKLHFLVYKIQWSDLASVMYASSQQSSRDVYNFSSISLLSSNNEAVSLDMEVIGRQWGGLRFFLFFSGGERLYGPSLVRDNGSQVGSGDCCTVSSRMRLDWIHCRKYLFIFNSLSCWGLNAKVTRAASWFAPSQWETALLCNDVSHWLGAISPGDVTPLELHFFCIKPLNYCLFEAYSWLFP